MSRRRTIWTALAAAVVVGGAFGLYWFQPWKLFVDHTVDETLPAAATEPVAVAQAERSVAPSTTAAPPAARLLSRGRVTSTTPRA